MAGLRTLGLLLLVVALGTLALEAHGPGGFRTGRGFHGGGGVYYGGYGGGFDFGFGGGYGGFYSPPILGYYNYGSNYLSVPYALPLPQRPQYSVGILEASHDWRGWSPTTKLIVGRETIAYGTDGQGTPTAGNERVIGMGAPKWAQDEPEPLGDVARRYRALAKVGSAQRLLAAQRPE